MDININYKNKYIKYKNKYIDYQNQHGGKCDYSFDENEVDMFGINLTEVRQKHEDNIIEEIFNLPAKICVNVRSIINSININTKKGKFPWIGFDTNSNLINIHTIWDTMLANNRVNIHNIRNNIFDAEPDTDNLCYLYTFTTNQYVFITKCLNLLMYCDIFSYIECTNLHIPDLIIESIRDKIIDMMPNGTILYDYNEEKCKLDNLSSNLNELNTIHNTMSGLEIVIALLNLLTTIINNRLKYNEEELNEFASINKDTINYIADHSNNVQSGRKIRNILNIHFEIKNIMHYITIKIHTDNPSTTWPYTKIVIYNNLSLHTIWSCIVKYNNNVSKIFKYTKFVYNFINYSLYKSLHIRINELMDIQNNKLIYQSSDISHIYLKYFSINPPNNNLEATNFILKLVLNTIYDIINIAKINFFNTTDLLYRENNNNNDIFIGNIPIFQVVYFDNNYITQSNDTLEKYVTIKPPPGNNFKNHLINVFLISYKLNIILEYINYIDIYNCVDTQIKDSILEYINKCREYEQMHINRTQDSDNTVKTNLDFINYTFTCINKIKLILDIFNIIVCILLNSIQVYTRIPNNDVELIIHYIYMKINMNLSTYCIPFKNYTIMDIMQYTLYNIDILLTVEDLFLRLPYLIKNRNKPLSDKLSELIKLLIEEYKNISYIENSIYPSNPEVLKTILLTIGYTLNITNNPYIYNLDDTFYKILNSDDINNYISNILNIFEESDKIYSKYDLLYWIILNMTNNYIKV